MEKQSKTLKKEKIISLLKTVYDPEITINIYEMGLIYDIKIHAKNKVVDLLMTFTTPNCPVVVKIIKEIKKKIETLHFIKNVNIILTFDPSWNKSMMSNEAKLELGIWE